MFDYKKYDKLFEMQRMINDGLILNVRSMMMRIKRLEGIVESLSDELYDDLETPSGLGLNTGTGKR